jgi:hypothetical protein
VTSASDGRDHVGLAADVVLATKFDNLKDGLAAKVVGLPGESKVAERDTVAGKPAASN